MRSIIDWLALLCVVNATGFMGLFILVGLLFKQHDQSVLAKLDALLKVVKGAIR